jgi:hypothetical protein
LLGVCLLYDLLGCEWPVGDVKVAQSM